MKVPGDVITVIDSILEEAGDAGAPVIVDPEIVQGWIDRLRGLRAALTVDEATR
jgi:hypothetical protein